MNAWPVSAEAAAREMRTIATRLLAIADATENATNAAGCGSCQSLSEGSSSSLASDLDDVDSPIESANSTNDGGQTMSGCTGALKPFTVPGLNWEVLDLADKHDRNPRGVSKLKTTLSGMVGGEPSDLSSSCRCFHHVNHVCFSCVGKSGCRMLSVEIHFPNHCSSPVVADSTAGNCVTNPALTVQEGTDISSPVVGVAGACDCATPADSLEKKNPGCVRGSETR